MREGRSQTDKQPYTPDRFKYLIPTPASTRTSKGTFSSASFQHQPGQEPQDAPFQMPHSNTDQYKNTKRHLFKCLIPTQTSTRTPKGTLSSASFQHRPGQEPQKAPFQVPHSNTATSTRTAFWVRTTPDWHHLSDGQVKTPTNEDFTQLMSTPLTTEVPYAHSLNSYRIYTSS